MFLFNKTHTTPDIWRYWEKEFEPIGWELVDGTKVGGKFRIEHPCYEFWIGDGVPNKNKVATIHFSVASSSRVEFGRILARISEVLLSPETHKGSIVEP